MSSECFERAMKYFKHALMINSNDIESLYGITNCLFRIRVSRTGGQPLNQESNGQYLSTYNISINDNLTAKSTNQGNLDNSDIWVSNLNKILEQDKDYFLAYRLLGEIYLARQDYDNAVINIKKGIEIVKRDAYSFMLLGKILQETGS